MDWTLADKKGECYNWIGEILNSNGQQGEGQNNDRNIYFSKHTPMVFNSA